MTSDAIDEQFQQKRRALQIEIQRAESLLEVIKASFQRDDPVMLHEMCRHLMQAVDSMDGFATELRRDVGATTSG